VFRGSIFNKKLTALTEDRPVSNLGGSRNTA
jgi:hypothetical protein